MRRDKIGAEFPSEQNERKAREKKRKEGKGTKESIEGRSKSPRGGGGGGGGRRGDEREKGRERGRKSTTATSSLDFFSLDSQSLQSRTLPAASPETSASPGPAARALTGEPPWP